MIPEGICSNGNLEAEVSGTYLKGQPCGVDFGEGESKGFKGMWRQKGEESYRLQALEHRRRDEECLVPASQEGALIKDSNSAGKMRKRERE